MHHRHRLAFEHAFSMYEAVAGLDCSQPVLEVRREQQQQVGHRSIRPPKRVFHNLMNQLI